MKLRYTKGRHNGKLELASNLALPHIPDFYHSVVATRSQVEPFHLVPVDYVDIGVMRRWDRNLAGLLWSAPNVPNSNRSISWTWCQVLQQEDNLLQVAFNNKAITNLNIYIAPLQDLYYEALSAPHQHDVRCHHEWITLHQLAKLCKVSWRKRPPVNNQCTYTET